MFAPIAVPIILAVTAAASAGAAVYQGQQQKEQADTQAKIERQRAAYARASAESDMAEYRRRQDRLLAQRRALLGGSGVESGVGSPLAVTEDFASEAELQALKIRQGGAVEATRLEQSASLLNAQGGAALTSGFMRGGALLLSGAGNVASNYVDAGAKGAPAGSWGNY
jgi:hypothetical protein